MAEEGIEGALPYQEVAAALETVDGSKASKAAKLCLRFLVLTAARSGEPRGARWSEIDTEAREWRIPGDRTKTGAPHRVPLSPEAMGRPGAGARRRRRQRPGLSGSPARLGTLQYDADEDSPRAGTCGSGDSSRDSALPSATGARETEAPRELAEAALAHTVGGVEGAYFRSDPFERRRALVESWGAFRAD